MNLSPACKVVYNIFFMKQRLFVEWLLGFFAKKYNVSEPIYLSQSTVTVSALKARFFLYNHIHFRYTVMYVLSLL